MEVKNTTTRVVAKATLPSEAAGALMKDAVMQSGTISIRQIGTNRVAVITGTATVMLPEAAISQLVQIPDGCSLSQLKGSCGTFSRATNSYEVTITFVK
jgi:hypothetical protein